jgi:hypothetical protein
MRKESFGGTGVSSVTRTWPGMTISDESNRLRDVFSYPVGPRLRLQSHLALDPRQEFANSLPVAAPIQMHEFGQVVALTACELTTTSNSASTTTAAYRSNRVSALRRSLSGQDTSGCPLVCKGFKVSRARAWALRYSNSNRRRRRWKTLKLKDVPDSYGLERTLIDHGSRYLKGPNSDRTCRLVRPRKTGSAILNGFEVASRLKPLSLGGQIMGRRHHPCNCLPASGKDDD